MIFFKTFMLHAYRSLFHRKEFIGECSDIGTECLVDSRVIVWRYFVIFKSHAIELEIMQSGWSTFTGFNHRSRDEFIISYDPIKFYECYHYVTPVDYNPLRVFSFSNDNFYSKILTKLLRKYAFATHVVIIFKCDRFSINTTSIYAPFNQCATLNSQ